MVWYRKPGFNRHGRVVLPAFYLAPPAVGVDPTPPEPGTEWFMSSFTTAPIYETGSSTDEVFVGAVYIDTSCTLLLKALLGSTKPGTNVTLEVRDAYTSGASKASVSTDEALADVVDLTTFSVLAGNYLYFFLSCASAECSWQCPAIVLVKQ